MRTFVIAILLAASTIVALAADPLPRSKGRVTDHTGTLSSQEVERVASNLKSFEDKAQVGILIVDAIDRDIADWTIDVFRTWGVGQKSRDNGMLLVMVKKTSQLRLEVGAGLDGIFPDQSAKIVLEQVREKLPNYFNAAMAGAVAIRAALADKERVGAHTQENGMMLGAWLVIGGVVFIIAMIFFSRRKKKDDAVVAVDPWQYDDRSSDAAASIGAASIGGYGGAGVAASSAAWQQQKADNAARYRRQVEAENDRRRRDEEEQRSRRLGGGSRVMDFAAGAVAGAVIDNLLYSSGSGSSHKSDNSVGWGGGDSSGAGASDSSSDSGGGGGGGDGGGGGGD